MSTDDKGQDTERQAVEMREFCKNRGWDLEFDLSDELSAAKLRPGLQELWKICRGRKVGVVVVHEFSRFARSTKELLIALDEFNSLGIQFVSLKEQIDTSTPAGKLVFTVIAAICEFEREMIRMRVKSGMAHAKDMGTVLGRRKRLSDRDIIYIGSRRAMGASWRTIASELRVSTETCRRCFLAASVSES